MRFVVGLAVMEAVAEFVEEVALGCGVSASECGKGPGVARQCQPVVLDRLARTGGSSLSRGVTGAAPAEAFSAQAVVNSVRSSPISARIRAPAMDPSRPRSQAGSVRPGAAQAWPRAMYRRPPSSRTLLSWVRLSLAAFAGVGTALSRALPTQDARSALLGKALGAEGYYSRSRDRIGLVCCPPKDCELVQAIAVLACAQEDAVWERKHVVAKGAQHFR
jgi:hypothetical protein